MDFVIDRSKWRCGEQGRFKMGKGNTRLLNQLGYMCCLGQCALQIGYEKDEIKGVMLPSQLEYKKRNPFNRHVSEYYVGTKNTRLSDAAFRINDDVRIDNEQREKKLISLFKRHGHSITFIN